MVDKLYKCPECSYVVSEKGYLLAQQEMCPKCRARKLSEFITVTRSTPEQVEEDD